MGCVDISPSAAIGPKDLENGTIEVARRDTKEKNVISIENALDVIPGLLEEMQNAIFNKSKGFREENTVLTDSWEEFKDIIENKGGFVLAHWDGTPETEDKIKEETKATIRCIPFDEPDESGKCIYTGRPSAKRVIFAKAY